MSKDPQKIISTLVNRAFKENVLSGDAWFSSAQRNEYLGELLYKRYEKAHKKFLKRENTNYPAKLSLEQIFNEAQEMTLHRHVLMFFGLALECYLKAYIVRNRKINTLTILKENRRGNLEISDRTMLSHNLLALIDMSQLKMSFDSEIFKNLERATSSGKYSIEKNSDFTRSYTADFEKTVSLVRSLIKIVGGKLK